MAAVYQHSQQSKPQDQHQEPSYQPAPGDVAAPAAHGSYGGQFQYAHASPAQQTLAPGYHQFPMSPLFGGAPGQLPKPISGHPVWGAGYPLQQAQSPQSGTGPSQPPYGYQAQQLPQPQPVPQPPQLQSAHLGGQQAQVYGSPSHGSYGGPQITSAQGVAGGYERYGNNERVQQLRNDVQPAATWPVSQQQPRLPPGWTAYWDQQQQKHYYSHAASGQTTWDPPQALYPVPPIPSFTHPAALTQSPQNIPSQSQAPQQQRLSTPIQLPRITAQPLPHAPQPQDMNVSADSGMRQYQRPPTGTPVSDASIMKLPTPVATHAELCAEPNSSAAHRPASQPLPGQPQTISPGPPPPPKVAEPSPTVTREPHSPPHSQIEVVTDATPRQPTPSQPTPRQHTPVSTATAIYSNFGQASAKDAGNKPPVKRPQPSNIDPSVSPLSSPPQEPPNPPPKRSSTPPCMSPTSHGPLSMTEDELSPSARRVKPNEDEPHVSATFTALGDDPMFTGLMVNRGLNAPHNSGMVTTQFVRVHGGHHGTITPPSPAISIRNPKPVVPPGAMEVPLLRQRDSVVSYGSPAGMAGGFPPPPQANGMMGMQQQPQQGMQTGQPGHMSQMGVQGIQIGPVKPGHTSQMAYQQRPVQQTEGQSDPQQNGMATLQQYHSALAQRAISKHEGSAVDRLRMLAEDLAALSNTIYTALERLPAEYVDELAGELSNDWEIVEMDTMLRGVLVTHGREEQSRPNDRWRKQGPPGYHG